MRVVQVILLRHGEAGDRDPRRYPDDGQRPLTTEGRRIHLAVAAALRRIGVRFDSLLTSPLVRARETAELTASAYDWRDPITVVPALGDQFTVDALLEALRPFAPSASVCCVGHEPHLSAFAAACVAHEGRAAIDLEKSGVIGLESEGLPTRNGATLTYLLRPQQLLALS
jgi:phosphohistidine phosphatase